MEEDYSTTETWNMAEAFLKRVDKLFWDCYFYRDNGLLDQWYKALDNLFIEVSSKIAKHKDDVNEKLKKAIPFAAKFSAHTLSKEDAGHLVILLREIDILLHQAIDDKGLLTPKPADARTAITGAR